MDRIDYLDSLLSLPSISDPKVSPDGKWIAWTWYRVGPASDIFAIPLDSSDEPLRLTETSENTTLVSWTKDSKGLIVAQDKGGSERAQLFLVKLSQPLEMTSLTEPDPQFFIQG